MSYAEIGKCSICGDLYGHYGHNPEPLRKLEERCCNWCNAYLVIPARLRAMLVREQESKLERT